MAVIREGHFYIQFHDETVDEAIENHSIGFVSVQDALDEVDAIERPGHAYVILNDKKEVVATGTTKLLPGEKKETTPSDKEKIDALVKAARRARQWLGASDDEEDVSICEELDNALAGVEEK